MNKTWIVPLLVLLVGCAKDPRDVRLTSQNKQTFMDEIAHMKGLTVDEVRLLIGFQVRQGFDSAFGKSSSGGPEAGTVGDLLVLLKKQAVEDKKREDQQKRLADEAKAKEDALASELQKSIELTVFEKGFMPSNPMGGRYTDQINIKCAYQNLGKKDIRAFRGRVRFTDLFGAEIFVTTLTISDPVGAGTKGTWDGVIEYNQFMSPHQRLRSTDLKDMKVVWLPQSVIFSDGSKLGNGEE